MRNSLRQPPCVDEYQGGAMLLDQLYQAVVNFVPHFVGGDGAKLACRHFHCKIELAFVSHIHDDRLWAAIASQKSGYFFDRLLGCGKSDAHRWTIGKSFQPLQRESQMRPALVVGDCVNFIHDDGLNIAQNGSTSFRSQQDVKRLRSGDQNVRRTLQHRAALVHQRVAGADGGTNLGHQQTAFARHLKNLAQRPFKIFLNVVAQRLQRGDVENLGAVVQISCQGLADQPVNTGQKRSQSFARTSRR